MGVLTHFVYTPTSRDEVRFLGGVQRLVPIPMCGRARFGAATSSRSTNSCRRRRRGSGRERAPGWSRPAWCAAPSTRTSPSRPPGPSSACADGPVQQQFPATAYARGRAGLSGWFDPVHEQEPRRAHRALRRPHQLATPIPRRRSTSRRRRWTACRARLGLRLDGLDLVAWHRRFSAYLTDQFRYRQLTVNAGSALRVFARSAANSEGRIEWTGVTPRVAARCGRSPTERPGLTPCSRGYAEYQSRLSSSASAAHGDPNAHARGAAVSMDRPEPRPASSRRDERGLLIARVGPGGVRERPSIPALQPTRSKEVLIGIEAQIRTFTTRFLALHPARAELWSRPSTTARPPRPTT